MSNWNTIASPTLTSSPSWNHMGTLNLSSTTSTTMSNILDGLLHLEDTSKVKKFQSYEISEDLLALSCAWFRLRNASPGTPVPGSIMYINNLLCNDLFDCVKEEDRIAASTIRDYYSKKLVMMNLKGMNLTPFRQDMSEYLHGPSNKFNEKMLPLVYRLPEFYEYDVEFDTFKNSFTQEIPKAKNSISKNLKTVLYPVKSLPIRAKKRKGKDYWLCDSDKNAYLFYLQHNAPLSGLWEREFNKPNIDLTMKVTIGSRDSLYFFNIAQIKEVG